MKTLGDHVILKTLGEGTFGDVYLAEHRFTKKKYAIKVLSQNLSRDKEFVKKFEEDIKILATLDHPSIVKLHNISFHDIQGLGQPVREIYHYPNQNFLHLL